MCSSYREKLKVDSQRLCVATNIAQFFIALKRTRGCIMTLEGSVAEHLFDIKKQKTCHIPHIYEYHLFHKKKVIQEYIVELTFN